MANAGHSRKRGRRQDDEDETNRRPQQPGYDAKWAQWASADARLAETRTAYRRDIEQAARDRERWEAQAVGAGAGAGMGAAGAGAGAGMGAAGVPASTQDIIRLLHEDLAEPRPWWVRSSVGMALATRTARRTDHSDLSTNECLLLKPYPMPQRQRRRGFDPRNIRHGRK